jgi:L-seryl-tRNA(Ser) seleniumtransferase
MTSPERRSIPSVERVLQHLGPTTLPRPLLLQTVRGELDTLRAQGGTGSFEAVLDRIRHATASRLRTRLQPVINATGIVIHTNLGRAPLALEAADAVRAAALEYSNLEYDIESGERGSRGAYVEQALAALCSAEAVTVVNNCAAALVLILRQLTAGQAKEVLISRGELVQIGGGFRIPDILETSGARLREVGTTNQTTAEDYAQAISPATALLLKVHPSNFYMGGFVHSVPTETLAPLAQARGVPLVEDLGSGAMVPTEAFAGLDHEPTPAEVLQRGVDLVCCSGDKLFGGPQAGIIAGRAPFVAALKRNPFFRALRCDKLTLSALQATAELYLRDAARDAIPVLALLHTPVAVLRERAQRICDQLQDLPLQAGVGEAQAQTGGGTLPRSAMPSATVELRPSGRMTAERIAAQLRSGYPTVIGCVTADRVRLDLRTVFPAQDEPLVRCLRTALGVSSHY